MMMTDLSMSLIGENIKFVDMIQVMEQKECLWLVAFCGNGQGSAHSQLNHPRHIFIDDDQSIYVSDRDNHCVMKWLRNAREGIVVTGDRGEESSLEQLSWPSGIFVNQTGSVYAADKEITK